MIYICGAFKNMLPFYNQCENVVKAQLKYKVQECDANEAEK
jgi:hypothetical protein